MKIRTGLLATLAGLAAIGSVLLGGCGAGDAITGGGVPLGGGRAQTSGEVVQAVDPTQAVAGSTVTLTASDGTAYTSTTDATGSFQFASVSVGRGSLSVAPPQGSSLAPVTLPVDVESDPQEVVAAALAPSSPGFTVTGISVSPPSITLALGQSAPVTVTVQGSNIPPTLQPSLVLSGGVGHLTHHGTVFHATHRGSGTLTAILAGQTASIPVVVE